MNHSTAVAFSVDLEPNKDGSLDDVRDAMEWYDRTIPRGTVFVTRRIATELPNVVDDLSTDHEVGVHVHPREFGHEHDQLAELSQERQAELVSTTRKAVANAARVSTDLVTSFRAGRHSASEETIDVLRELDFGVDASVHVRYDNHFPESITSRADPFVWNGIVEVPTSFARLPVFSRCGLRSVAEGVVTATASTLRTDSWMCSGDRAIQSLLSSSGFVSFYMHPYDATSYHSQLSNGGSKFRRRVEQIVSDLGESSTNWITMSDACAYRVD